MTSKPPAKRKEVLQEEPEKGFSEQRVAPFIVGATRSGHKAVKGKAIAHRHDSDDEMRVSMETPPRMDYKEDVAMDPEGPKAPDGILGKNKQKDIGEKKKKVSFPLSFVQEEDDYKREEAKPGAGGKKASGSRNVDPQQSSDIENPYASSIEPQLKAAPYVTQFETGTGAATQTWIRCKFLMIVCVLLAIFILLLWLGS